MQTSGEIKVFEENRGMCYCSLTVLLLFDKLIIVSILCIKAVEVVLVVKDCKSICIVLVACCAVRS